jgi:F0F1-type ATP synthase epsilon subunit
VDKIPLKADDSDVVTGLQNALAEAQKKKEKATSDEDRLSAAALFEAARAKIKAVSG